MLLAIRAPTDQIVMPFSSSAHTSCGWIVQVHVQVSMLPNQRRPVGKMRKVVALPEHAPRVALPPADGRDGGYRHQRAVRARRGTADLVLLRTLRSFASRLRY